MHRLLGSIILVASLLGLVGCAAAGTPAALDSGKPEGTATSTAQVPQIPVTPRSGAKVGPTGAYRWSSRYPADWGGSSGILVREVSEGGSRFIEAKMLSPTGRGQVACITSPSGRTEMYFDALGSWDIHVAVGPDVGFTTYAGLVFRGPCAVEILADGTVIVDAEGIVVTDRGGRKWKSRAMESDGVQMFAFSPE